jgi:hypothetical protein
MDDGVQYTGYGCSMPALSSAVPVQQQLSLLAIVSALSSNLKVLQPFEIGLARFEGKYGLEHP